MSVPQLKGYWISNENDQKMFISYIYTTYIVSHFIMDQFHLQKIHGNQIQDIENIAKIDCKLESCDIGTCQHSSRLYRVEDKLAQLNVFDDQDKESVFNVVMDMIDGLHHFIFHIYQCGLRVKADDISDCKDIDNQQEMNEYYDPEYQKLEGIQTDLIALMLPINSVSILLVMLMIVRILMINQMV